MIKICRNWQEIQSYKNIAYMNSGIGSIPTLTINADMFVKARKLFSEGAILISVKDNAGSDAFYLKHQKDLIENNEGHCIEVDINYDGAELDKEENLDVTLLEKADSYIFYELEEYTYEIAKFISLRYPKKKVYFFDSYVKYFLEEEWGNKISYIDSEAEFYDMPTGNCLYITSDWRNHNDIVPDYVSHIYNSINVMSSLCWARKLSNLGSMNEEKTVLIIDCDFGTSCGLAYIVRFVCVYVQMAYERGWMPVVNLTGDNMYIDNDTDNMWDQYFEAVSDISLDAALKSSRVVNLRNNAASYCAIYYNPYFRRIWSQNAKWKINLKTEVEEQFREKMDKALLDKDEKVLGILVRGTDMPKLCKSDKSTQSLIEESMEVFREGKFSKIFLATEDEEYFNQFRNAFGDKITYVDQTRKKSGDQAIGDQLGLKRGQRKEFGLKYLSITYYLSQCDALLYNFPVGAYYLMNKWRCRPMEFMHQIGSKNEQHEIDILAECISILDNNNLTAVYGIGKNTEKIYKYFEKYRNKIVFVDKKAREEKLFFHDINVITLEKLIFLYQSDKIKHIIITTVKYGMEIKTELEKRGIPSKSIIWIKNEEGLC